MTIEDKRDVIWGYCKKHEVDDCVHCVLKQVDHTAIANMPPSEVELAYMLIMTDCANGRVPVAEVSECISKKDITIDVPEIYINKVDSISVDIRFKEDK